MIYATLDDLTAGSIASRPRDHVLIEGGGFAKGVTFESFNLQQLTFKPSVSVLRASLPRWASRLRPGYDIPIFEDCVFVDLRARLDLWACRFFRCHFADVSVTGGLIQAHFVDCHFSGRWDANFTRKADPLDPKRRVSFSGNDLQSLEGMDFFDGVQLDENRFDVGGRHVILRYSDLSSAEVSAFLAGRQWGVNATERLRLNHNQDWLLLERAMMSSGDWETTRSLLAT